MGSCPACALDPDRVRVYPNQALAAHVLGFVGEGSARPGDVVGQAGVEAWYNDVLGGQSGLVSSDIDRLGRRIPTGRYALQPPRHGAHVTLSIDRTIQHIAEQELEAAIEQFGANAGTILITDPRTGEILGLANRPPTTRAACTRITSLAPSSPTGRAVSSMSQAAPSNW